MALETFCDNCGCNISERDDSKRVYSLTVMFPGKNPVTVNTKKYDLCCCCAEGIVKLLDENVERIHATHGATCNDILPVGYRCGHSPVED